MYLSLINLCDVMVNKLFYLMPTDFGCKWVISPQGTFLKKGDKYTHMLCKFRPHPLSMIVEVRAVMYCMGLSMQVHSSRGVEEVGTEEKSHDNVPRVAHAGMPGIFLVC
jgi:hypothetical protein